MSAVAQSQPAHIVHLVRRLRAAGVPPPAAEAIGETMEQVATKAELRAELYATKAELRAEIRAAKVELRAEMKAMEERIDLKIRLALADSFRKTMLASIAMHGLSVAVLVLVLK